MEDGGRSQGGEHNVRGGDVEAFLEEGAPDNLAAISRSDWWGGWRKDLQAESRRLGWGSRKSGSETRKDWNKGNQGWLGQKGTRTSPPHRQFEVFVKLAGLE